MGKLLLALTLGKKGLFLKKMLEMTLSSSAKTQEIPSYLIYEMDDGKPIYYKAIMADSTLQAWLKSELCALLKIFLPAGYITTVGEQGLQLGKLKWRAADVAIFKKENFALSNHYSSKAPEIAIEIDTKADLDSPGASIDYFDRKNRQLLEFGVKKIIWIFTEVQAIKVLVPGEDVQHFEWEEDITVMEGVQFNLRKIMDQLL
jgi:hypothetical protein